MGSDQVWITCKDWQAWINGKTIKTGQPVLKQTRVGNTEEKILAIVNNSTKKFYQFKERVYFPKSLDQIMEFLRDKLIFTECAYEKGRVIFKIGARMTTPYFCEGKTWYGAAAALVKKLQDEGRLR